MAEKYAWLTRVVLDVAGPARPSDLREAARRWPGALRECQRVSPQRYRERGRAAIRASAENPQSRAIWRSRGQAALCLWSELHQLHADLLAWRAGSPASRTVDDFLRDLTCRDPARRRAWPDSAVVRGWAIPGVGARLAESCLAERAELSLDALRRCLLDLDDGAS